MRDRLPPPMLPIRRRCGEGHSDMRPRRSAWSQCRAVACVNLKRTSGTIWSSHLAPSVSCFQSARSSGPSSGHPCGSQTRNLAVSIGGALGWCSAARWRWSHRWPSVASDGFRSHVLDGGDRHRRLGAIWGYLHTPPLLCALAIAGVIPSHLAASR